MLREEQSKNGRKNPATEQTATCTASSVIRIRTQLFLKKLLNNKIFCTLFVVKKKVYLIFGTRHLLFLKNRQMCSQNSFTWFSLKILAFFLKNCWIRKYSASNFWRKRLPSSVEGREAQFNPYFDTPKYRSSDALPTPEFFFNDVLYTCYRTSKMISYLKGTKGRNVKA